MATVDWLAKVLYEAAERATEEVGIRPAGETERPWLALSERQQEAVRQALTATLEALDEPPLLKLREGEVIFALRAHDECAPAAIAAWIAEAEKAGSSRAKLDRALTKMRAVLDWQKANGHKVPD